MSLEIRPISFKEASEYIERFHRHNGKTVGCKFTIGCFDGDKLVGVAVCGRPVSRHYDDGLTLEINRVCTDGTYNACSILYGASSRIAKDMGYKKVITYTLVTENGASLKASGFKCEGQTGGIEWTGIRNPKNKEYQQISLFPQREKPHYMKQRWVKRFATDSEIAERVEK